MNKNMIFLMLVLTVLSCKNDNRIIDEIHKLYEEDVGIENIEVKTIFANDNKLKKIKNFLLMNELYIKKDSVLQVMVDNDDKKSNNGYTFNTKNDELLQKLNSNKKAHSNQIEELNNEILKLDKKGNGRVKYYLVYYDKKNIKSEYTILMDSKFNIIYSQDPKLN